MGYPVVVNGSCHLTELATGAGSYSASVTQYSKSCGPLELLEDQKTTVDGRNPATGAGFLPLTVGN